MLFKTMNQLYYRKATEKIMEKAHVSSMRSQA